MEPHLVAGIAVVFFIGIIFGRNENSSVIGVIIFLLLFILAGFMEVFNG